jgi:hypothetical protein
MEVFTDDIKPRAGGASERLFILSTVSPSLKWDSALALVEAYHGEQCLLGWDAQLKAFGAMLERLGVPCLVTPAPELFFTPTALRVAADSAGISASSFEAAVHIRFGGGRFARILRGMPNFIATAECARTGVLAPGAHPFRGQNTGPHALQAMLDLSGEAGPLMRPDGSEIERIAVPRSIVGADVPDLQLTARPLSRADFDGLEISALAESGGADAAMLQARRLMLEFNTGGLALERKLVLLPWNLANPASCVPDVAVNYLRAFAETEHACHLVLMPFNLQREFASQIEALIGGIKRELAAMLPNPADFQPAKPLPAGLMIGRVSDFSGLATLRRMGAVAWVDGADPEAAWTEARLAACGVPAVSLPAGDEKTMTEVRDEFGHRFFEGRTLAARDMALLAQKTLDFAQAPLENPSDLVLEHQAFEDLLKRVSAVAAPPVS